MNNFELRILIREHQHVLQYRKHIMETRYTDGKTGPTEMKEMRWSQWIDVPIVEEE